MYVAQWSDTVKDPVLSGLEASSEHYTLYKGDIACDTLSRVCRYKHINFAIATAKGSPLR